MKINKKYPKIIEIYFSGGSFCYEFFQVTEKELMEIAKVDNKIGHSCNALIEKIIYNKDCETNLKRKIERQNIDIPVNQIPVFFFLSRF